MSNPGDITNVIASVYRPLKLSYDFLDNAHLKSLLLLCCLSVEDRNIPLERLKYIAMGLHMFEGVKNLDDARSKTVMLVRVLKKRFLLMDGQDEEHAQIHDVVRDVSIFIAAEERRINCNDCTWISSYVDGRAKSQVELGFPNLRFLWIDNSVDDEFQIQDSLIEEMLELNVMIVEHGPFKSLPNTIPLLKNLRTLIMYKCVSLETVSIVSQLVNLEILLCYKCRSIAELPAEIGRLKKLRLLRMTKCENLEKVATGAISGLSGLEELQMVQSFDKWKAEDKGKETENASLSELQSLTKLMRLDIEVDDYTLVSEEIRLSPKLARFDISIGNRQKRGPRVKGFEKNMTIWLENEVSLGTWIRQCAASVEFACLSGDGVGKLDFAQAQENLKSLTLKYCSTLERLLNATTTTTTTTVFLQLEYLQLSNLPNLQEICHIDASISYDEYSFASLKELRLEELPALKQLRKSNHVLPLSYNSLSSIYINQCDGLQHLFSLTTAAECLSQLETLAISNCNMIEQIFSWNEEAEEDMKDDVGEEGRGRILRASFPKLKTLNLSDLPKLTALCRGIEGAEFPQLADLTIMRCLWFKAFVSGWDDVGGGDHSDGYGHSLHTLCKSKVTFGNLEDLYINGCNDMLWCHRTPTDIFTKVKELRMDYCDKIRSSFSSSIAQSLVGLKKLKIRSCKEMVKVIDDEEEKCSHVCSGGPRNHRLFPALRYLELKNLPKLEIFCDWKSCALVELPLLESLLIHACPRMKRFSWGSLATPKLNIFKIDNVSSSKAINEALQQH